jgi:hypothetical protein
MTTTSSAITVKSVSKSFGRGDAAIRVLQDVSVEIGAREFFTLLGPSGCGKTTLLRLIAGFEDLDSGSIEIEGVRIDQLPPFQRPVNTVFQSYALFPHLTVAQNVAFALEMQNLSAAEVRRRAGEALEMVRMGAFSARKPSELSGGHGRLRQHKGQLGLRLDGPGSDLPYRRHSLGRRNPKFHHEPGSRQPRPAEPAFAMNKDVEPGAQACPQPFTRLIPAPFKARVRHRDISNRQVQPIHVPRPDLRPKVHHTKGLQLMRFRQANHRNRAPVGNCVQIDVQLSVPRPRRRIPLPLARAERDPDPTRGRRRANKSNLKGMRVARAHARLRKRPEGRRTHACPAQVVK